MPPSRKRRLNPEKQARFVVDMQQGDTPRVQETYRERALAMFPHLCARCWREFSGKNLRELTVHHRDGNHMNNPPDGSNWELLCVYCHDYEHQNLLQEGYSAGATQERHSEGDLDFHPFEGLKDKLKPEDEQKEE